MTKIVSLSNIYHLRSTVSVTKTIVLVTGVFDIIHSEHKKLLQAAKQQADILLVGLEPDIRVRELKGTTRPINTINERLKNIKRLKLADYVFELPTNLNTKKGREAVIKNLKPNILAASVSTPNLSEKRRIMKLIGGRVKIVLPHNPKVSSSKLLSNSS